MPPCSESYRQKIQALFIAEKQPSPKDWEELRAHLSTCDACRQAYDQLRESEALLAGDSGSNRPADERLLRVIVPSTPARAIAPLAPAKFFLLRPLLAATAVLLLVFGAWWWLRPSDSQDGFQAKGKDDRNPTIIPMEVRAMCLTTSASGKTEVIPLARAARPEEIGQGCPIDGVVQFICSNPPNGRPYLFLIGLTDKGEVRYYFPNPQEKVSLALPRGVTDFTHGQGIKLAVNHRPELIRIYALFSESPLPIEEVERSLLEAYKALGKPPAKVPLEPPNDQNNFWIRIQGIAQDP